jgi:hypothetical protein
LLVWYITKLERKKKKILAYHPTNELMKLAFPIIAIENTSILVVDSGKLTIGSL